MPSPSSLVRRDPFAKEVASDAPTLMQLTQEAIADAKRAAPQWRKFGLKVLDLDREWEIILDEQEENEGLEAAARTPKKKRNGGSHDEDWAKSLLAKKKGGRVEKVKGKKARKTGRKWGHVNVSKGYGRYALHCLVEVVWVRMLTLGQSAQKAQSRACARRRR
jgi:hypothetical protein